MEPEQRSPSSEQQKEARHRKDDAAGRQFKDEGKQSKQAQEEGRKHKDGKPEEKGASEQRRNPAKHLAGIWKELNDDSKESDSDAEREQREQVFCPLLATSTAHHHNSCRTPGPACMASIINDL